MKRALIFCLSLLSMAVFAQNKAVQGTVIDNDQFPMPGALVKEVNTGLSTVTNDFGQFTLSGLEGATAKLSFTSFGYEPLIKEITLDATEVTNLQVVVSKATNELSEVIVTGSFLKNQAKALSTQRQNTGVTNVVNADQIGRTPDANIGTP